MQDLIAMAAGVDKTKINNKKRGYSGYQLYPRYSSRYRPPTEKQIAYMKDLWRQLNEHGVEETYRRRALVNGSLASSEMRRAQLEAKKHGIEFKKEEAY